MKNDVYNLLLRSFDTKLSEEEEAILERALVENQELKTEQVRLERLRNLLDRQELEFAPFFSTRVLAGIESLSDIFSDRLFFVFRRMAIVSLVIVVALIIGVYLQDGALTLNTITGISDLGSGNAESLLLYGWNK